jgi:hypothetical protein
MVEVKKHVEVEIDNFKKIVMEEMVSEKKKLIRWGIFAEERAMKVKKLIVQGEMGCGYDDSHGYNDGHGCLAEFLEQMRILGWCCNNKHWHGRALYSHERGMDIRRRKGWHQWSETRSCAIVTRSCLLPEQKMLASSADVRDRVYSEHGYVWCSGHFFEFYLEFLLGCELIKWFANY